MGVVYNKKIDTTLTYNCTFKLDLSKGTSSKNHGQIKIIRTSFQFTEYV